LFEMKSECQKVYVDLRESKYWENFIMNFIIYTYIVFTTWYGNHVRGGEMDDILRMLWNIINWHTVLVGETDGSARPRPTALLSPRSEGKTRGCYCSCGAPDDKRENARNMLSCKYTSSNILEKLLHLVGRFIWII
jgi:hypothetical protein